MMKQQVVVIRVYPVQNTPASLNCRGIVYTRKDLLQAANASGPMTVNGKVPGGCGWIAENKEKKKKSAKKKSAKKTPPIKEKSGAAAGSDGAAAGSDGAASSDGAAAGEGKEGQRAAEGRS